MAADPPDDDDREPPDLAEANAFGDKLWEALRGSFVTCGGCGIPWRSTDVVCAGCKWFPDPAERVLN